MWRTGEGALNYNVYTPPSLIPCTPPTCCHDFSSYYDYHFCQWVGLSLWLQLPTTRMVANLHFIHEILRHELLLALLAGRVLVVFWAGHGHLGRVALLIQQLLEGIQLVALVQGREISRLQHITTGYKSTILQQLLQSEIILREGSLWFKCFSHVPL